MKKISALLFLISALAMQDSPAQNNNIVLAGHLSYGPQVLSNIWGWKHPGTGKEYALVGAADGLSIVDVTNPSTPVEIVEVPPQDSNSQNCSWREVKTWGNYAYVTTECGKTGLQIIDLSGLPNTNLTTVNWTPGIMDSSIMKLDTMWTIHALHIDNGRLYLYGGNLQTVQVADVSTTPMNPIYLGTYSVGGYIHDGYVQGDTMYAGHIWAGTVEIVDMSNPANGVALASFQTPGTFTHNTWLSSDSKICYTTDEVNDSYLTGFDISNLSNIFETDRIKTDPDSGVIVHNTYITRKSNNDYAVTSWYKSGITIVDAGRPHNLVQVGNFDTSPLSGSGYGGCWGVYPYLPSGTIVASDIEEGLFVLTPSYPRACYLEGKVINCTTTNPILGVTVTITLAGTPKSDAHIDVTDAQGDYAVGVAAPGTYFVTYSKPGFNTDVDTVVLAAGVVNTHNIQFCPLGIGEEAGYASVTIRPNPFKGSTVLDVEGLRSSGNIELNIYNILGKLIRQSEISNSTGNISIPVSGLTPGMYFYQLMSDGKMVASGKLCAE